MTLPMPLYTTFWTENWHKGSGLMLRIEITSSLAGLAFHLGNEQKRDGIEGCERHDSMKDARNLGIVDQTDNWNVRKGWKKNVVEYARLCSDYGDHSEEIRRRYTRWPSRVPKQAQEKL